MDILLFIVSFLSSIGCGIVGNSLNRKIQNRAVAKLSIVLMVPIHRYLCIPWSPGVWMFGSLETPPPSYNRIINNSRL